MPALHVDETSSLLGQRTSGTSPSRDASQEPDIEVHSKRSTSLVLKIAAAMYSFVTLGLLTSTIGVMLPPILKHYDLSDIGVSLIFLVGPVGYVLAAQSNTLIHISFGQLGVAILGPILHILSCGVIALHPPFSVVLVAFAFVAAGTGLLDGSWCAWAGNMDNANTVSGLLHGSFSVGAAVGPLLATMLAGNKWFYWYYVLGAISFTELLILGFAFRYENASRYSSMRENEISRHSNKATAIFKYRGTWFSAIYFLAYVGTETAISGWVVSFMFRAREATPAQANLSSSGFWAGMAVGRFALGTVADRIGVAKAALVYINCAIALEVLFALIPLPVVSVITMTLLGFFMGPLFPSGIVVLTRLLPKQLHVAAVSFVASVGQVGAALLPFAIGAVVDVSGIGIFRFAIIAFTVLTLVLWMLFSRLQSTESFPLLDEQDD